MEIVRSHGLEIAYRRAGAGPPLVLVHGAASDGRMWQPQLAALADELTVVAWDEPGAGGSSDPPPTFGLADYASCLAALIESLALGPAHVAGLSWGGTVALELYRLRPGARRDADPDRLLRRLERLAARGGGERAARGPRADARRARGDSSIPTLPGLFAGEPPAEYLTLLEEVGAAVRPESMRTALTAMAHADLRDVLPSIAVPTLLVWGELDARAPLYVAHQLEREIPGASLVVIPDCGHVSNLERPEEVNAALRDSAARTRPEPAAIVREIAYALRSIPDRA